MRKLFMDNKQIIYLSEPLAYDHNLVVRTEDHILNFYTVRV